MSSDQHSPIATVVVDDEEQQTDDRISPPFAEFVAHVDDKTLRYNKVKCGSHTFIMIISGCNAQTGTIGAQSTTT